MEQKRQHEPQHLPEAAAAEGKMLRALLDACHGIGHFGARFTRATRHSRWSTGPGGLPASSRPLRGGNRLRRRRR